MNSAKINQLTNNILNNFNDIDNYFMKKWDFAMYFAFKELMDFYELLSEENSKPDLNLFVKLAEISYNFFNNLTKRLKDA